MKKITTTFALLVILCFIVVSLIVFFNAEHAEPSWVMWSQNYGGTNNEMATSLVQTSDGGYAIAGETSSFGSGDYDFWLIKTNEQGVPEFPSWIILPLFLTATFSAIVFRKRLLRARQRS